MTPEDNKRKPFYQNPVFWIVIVCAIAAMGFWNIFHIGSQKIDTQDGINLLKGQTVTEVTITEGEQKVDLILSSAFTKNGRDFGKSVNFYYVSAQEEQVVKLVNDAKLSAGYDVIVPQDTFWSSILQVIIPMLFIMLIFWFFAQRMQGGHNGKGGMGGIFGFGKSPAKMSDKTKEKVTFADVAGEDEAVEELIELKDFLSNPKKYHAVGAKIPKGVLLYGPPGTGKTLLARAVAGEANVPFFSISGSDFVEMFVGVGASRVRDLFEQAKKKAPAIVFVDEIDAVGRHRGSGMGGGHDEREQTLNQLLVEMDGFDPGQTVIVIAATNRPDILDTALLRPGRFDRQIAVESPDLLGREAILKVHVKDKQLAKDVDLKAVAKRTPGFTGADLANVLNEAALLIARENEKVITNHALDEAIDRVMAGPQRKSRVMPADELRNTAYHEAGHALVAAAMNYSDPVTKITILPRGRALGYTSVMPTEDRYSKTRNQLLDQMAYAMGGRVAEEIVFHDPTTGASNDLEKVTRIARVMITEFGMDEKVGAVALDNESQAPQMGYPGGKGKLYSDETAKLIDDEVRAMVENAHNEAYRAVMQNRKILDKLAKELLHNETLNEKELEIIFKDVKRIEPRKVWLSSKERPVSDLPPVAIVEKPASNTSIKSTQNKTVKALQSELKEAKKPTKTVVKKTAKKDAQGDNSDTRNTKNAAPTTDKTSKNQTNKVKANGNKTNTTKEKNNTKK